MRKRKESSIQLKVEKSCEVCKNTFVITKASRLHRVFCSNTCAKKVQWKGKFEPRTTIWDCSSRTICKILKRIEKMKCSRCGWSEGSCDLHHIHGRKIENPHQHSNLTILCPNCHRLAHEGKIAIEQLVNLDVFIGDAWKQAYYG